MGCVGKWDWWARWAWLVNNLYIGVRLMIGGSCHHVGEEALGLSRRKAMPLCFTSSRASQPVIKTFYDFLVLCQAPVYQMMFIMAYSSETLETDLTLFQHMKDAPNMDDTHAHIDLRSQVPCPASALKNSTTE